MTPQDLISTLSSVYEIYLRRVKKQYKKFNVGSMIRIRPNGIGSANVIHKNMRKTDFNYLVFNRPSENILVLDSYFGFRSTIIPEDASLDYIFDWAINETKTLLSELSCFQIVKSIMPIYKATPYISAGEPKLEKNFIFLPEEFFNRDIFDVIRDLSVLSDSDFTPAEKKGYCFKVYDYSVTIGNYTCVQTQEDIEAVIKSFKQSLCSSTFYENNDVIKLYYLKPNSNRFTVAVKEQLFTNSHIGLDVENAYFEENSGFFDFFAVGSINRKPLSKELCASLVKVLLKSAGLLSNDMNIFKSER